MIAKKTLFPWIFAMGFGGQLVIAEETKENNTGTATPAPSAMHVLPLEDLRVFTKAFDHIRNAYVEEKTDSELLEYAIRGMIAELDPHSVYLDATDFEDMKVHTSGEFGGLGIEVGMKDGFVRVISPIDDTPAANAGIETGDLIIKLDDTSVKGLDLGQAVELMRGKKGTDIILTIVREGRDQPFEVTITRDIIQVRSVRSEILEEHFGYIRIAQFQAKTGDDVKKEYQKLIAENDEIKGIILDLRNNPGGVLQASVAVADHFIDDGLLVYTKGRNAKSNVDFKAQAGDIAEKKPIIVLINGGSASASEIVAGALQDHNRAIIMGTRSFGKGSVQSIIPITEEKAIKITTARYYTPSGRSIQAAGITPDIHIDQVKVTAIRPNFKVSESDLQGHLENKDDEKKKSKSKSNNEKSNKKDSKKDDSGQRQNDLQNRDNQLYEAINMLRGISLYNKGLNVEAAHADDNDEATAPASDPQPTNIPE